MTGPARGGAFQAERLIGRLLTGITYVSVGLLVIGVLLLMATGTSPTSGGPRFDPGRLLPDVLSLRPAGFLWLGLVAVIAAPVSRVTVALLSYVRARDWLMAGVSTAILVVIAIAVGSAVVTTA
ncbi:MAG: DUF1634 domain-containing protein [Chloroflexi bacterium]|nr:DUF1634 domain-containing protein [Chloroflexota bacterium]